MTFRHSNELLLRIKANIAHDLMLHYGMLIYLKPCRNFEKVDNVQTKWELGSNYLLISHDFKNCMVIRAIYFKVFALANR